MTQPVRPARRIVASVALASFAAGLAAAAWAATQEDTLPVTHAALFEVPAIDMGLSGERGVDGFIGSPNLAPGDRVAGSLLLHVDQAPPEGTMDLDFAVRADLTGPSGAHRLDEALVVAHLAYGQDDLLSGADGGANLTGLLDANGDGTLSIRELSAGADDLPPPRTQAEGGTPFVLEVRFAPERSANSSDFRGQQLALTFVFRLADSASEDLE